MVEALYETHYPQLQRYAAAACKNEAEAEDLAQTVFLKALQNVHILEDLSQSQRRAWLFRTLKNELCDRYRRTKLEQDYLESCRETSCADPGIQAVENSMLLSRLRPEDRTLFSLRYEEGYTAAELAELFDLSPGTVRSRLCRSRSLLKQLLTTMEE